MVQVGPLLTKLWHCKVSHHSVNQFSPLCTGIRTYVKTACLHINSRRFFVHKEKRTTLVTRSGFCTSNSYKIVIFFFGSKIGPTF